MIRILEDFGTVCWLAMDLCWASGLIELAVGFGSISFLVHFICARYLFGSNTNWQTTSWVAFNLSWLAYVDVSQTPELKLAMIFLGIISVAITIESILERIPIKRG